MIYNEGEEYLKMKILSKDKFRLALYCTVLATCESIAKFIYYILYVLYSFSLTNLLIIHTPNHIVAKLHFVYVFFRFIIGSLHGSLYKVKFDHRLEKLHQLIAF